MCGSTSVLFDSSATIDIELRDGERVAVMRENHYGTQDESILLQVMLLNEMCNLSWQLKLCPYH